jgi:UDP-N-acetylglucosamine acyltransferase
VIVAGIRDRTRVSGINKVGLRRNGFSREVINNLDSVFRIIYRSPNLLLKDALQLARTEYPDCAEVQHMIDFFESSKRGVVRRTEESI